MKYGKCISLHFWLTYTINKHLSNQINSWHTILGYSIANQNLCSPVTKLVNIESYITNLYHILIIIPYTINISGSLGFRDKRGGGSECCVTIVLTQDFSNTKLNFIIFWQPHAFCLREIFWFFSLFILLLFQAKAKPKLWTLTLLLLQNSDFFLAY